MSDLRIVTTTGEYRGEELEVEVQGRECEGCRHVVVPGRLMPAFMTAVADAYRIKCDLLTSEQIKRARAQLQLSQADFAEYVGIGIATLKRVEHGEVQSKTIDELIRVKTDTTYAQQMIEDLFRRIAAPSKHREAAKRGNCELVNVADCDQSLAA
jgi:putative zinc finger/helix-turn-helix YgiT family protein